jgi:ubiquinone/menaquinone biosynthesis C-methylase UbiE
MKPVKSKDTQKFTEYYRKNRVTGTYDKQREGTPYRRKKRALELSIFLEMIDKQGKDKVLELGCSSGFLTKELGKVTAIDTSHDMLKIAHSKNKQAKCVPGDMFDIPFKSESFNKVVTMRVWNHLDLSDLKKAIKESKRVLKKNGWLIFDAEEKSFLRRFVGFFYQRLFKTTGYKIYQYSVREIKQILKQEGFYIEKARFLNHKVGRQFIMRCVLKEK